MSEKIGGILWNDAESSLPAWERSRPWALPRWRAGPAVKDGACGIAPHYPVMTPSDHEGKAGRRGQGFRPRKLPATSRRSSGWAVSPSSPWPAAMAGHGRQRTAPWTRPSPDRCGVIVSSGIGGLSITEAEHDQGHGEGLGPGLPLLYPHRPSPTWLPATSPSAHGFRGMCSCPVTACAGGTNAVGDAFHYIRDGYADVMLCGGSGGRRHASGHRRLHLHEGPEPERGPQPRLHPLRCGAQRLCHGRGRRHSAAGRALPRPEAGAPTSTPSWWATAPPATPIT